MGITVSGTLAADGDGTAHLVSSNDDVVSGVFLHTNGTWGGGTLIVEFESDDGTWRSLVDASFTADTSKQIIVPNGLNVRVSLSGATTPSLFYQLSSMSYAAS